MIEVGRLCTKIAGRDAGKRCVVLDIVDDNFILIDGETRRKKVNIKHVEPSDKIVDIKKGAAHKQVMETLGKIGITVVENKLKDKAEKPKKSRKAKTTN